jgi:hypothetical protein
MVEILLGSLPIGSVAGTTDIPTGAGIETCLAHDSWQCC